jgi:hypothetical protein
MTPKTGSGESLTKGQGQKSVPCGPIMSFNYTNLVSFCKDDMMPFLLRLLSIISEFHRSRQLVWFGKKSPVRG